MKKHVVWIAVAVIALGGFTVASAQDRESDAYLVFENSVRPMQKQVFDKRYELGELYRSGTRDGAQVDSLIAEIGQLQAQIMSERAKFGAGSDYDSFSPGPDGGYAHHGRGGWGGRGNGGGHRGGGRGWCW